MNREQRRAAARKLGKKGGQIFKVARDVTKTAFSRFKDGDEVVIQTAKIIRQPYFNDLLPEYQKFINEAGDKIFHVVHEEGAPHGLVCLEEDTHEPKWFFQENDLKKIV